jgi:ankyrin repeat protein
VATLLQAGAEVTSVTIQCYTVLHAAASSGSAALVQQMLDAHGSKARSSLRYLGRSAATAPYCTPLHLAVAEGFKEVVEVLIAAGAEVNKQDSEGAAPLHAAIAGNHQGLAEVLLAAGAGVNGQDTKGVTPLHLAAAAGLQEMVELLLAAGAGKELQDSQGCTPLHRALLAAVADVDAASHRQVQAAIAAGGG